WLKNKTLLQSLGISFDVFGDQRVDKLGRTRTQTIAANMQKLVDNDIDLGAIAVLSRSTLAHVRQIYEFYDSLRVGVRFLPFYMSADAAQVQVHELSYAEIVAALNSLFDAWMASNTATPVEPVAEYLGYATTWLGSGAGLTYDMRENECVFIVNTNGDTY